MDLLGQRRQVLDAGLRVKGIEAAILAALNLDARFSTTNMHLWGPEGGIKRYDSPEQIMDDFFPVRLRFYERRKEELERRLGLLVRELGNKHRFCKLVVDGEVVLFRKSRGDIEALLEQHGFERHPERGGYGYLTGTSVLDLSAERLDDLAGGRRGCAGQGYNSGVFRCA